MSKERMTLEQVAVSRLAAKRKERVTKVRQQNPNPTLVGKGLRRATEVTIIPASDLDTLKIDSKYQRPENRELVNQLLAVLEAGGMIPDPITVAVRPDKSRFIVDGQQRWAAHYLALKPIAAVLYYVDTIDEERRLFSVLNTYRRPSPSIRMRAWTGASARLIQWVTESPGSPLLGEVSFSSGVGGQTRHAAPTVLRGIGAALGVTMRSGASSATEEYMRALDRVYVADEKRAIRVAQAFLSLAKRVFEGGRWQSTPILALGGACAIRWENGVCAPPSKKALYNLRRMNWTNPPISERNRWLPVLQADVLKRWPA